MDKRIEQLVNESKFLNEVWLNTLVTTHVHYTYGWTPEQWSPVVGDLIEITNRWRERGVIK
jgi:hypothetical protein